MDLQVDLHQIDLEALGILVLDEVFVGCAELFTTPLLCWSDEEAARYLYTLKAYEKKTDQVLQGWNGCGHKGYDWKKKEWEDWSAMDEFQRSGVMAKEAVAGIKGMNKSNAKALLKRFGSLKSLVLCKDFNDLLGIESIGPRKVRSLKACFE